MLGGRGGQGFLFWPSSSLTPRGSRKSTLKSLAPYVKEHFANAAFGVYPIEHDSKIAIVVVANKYSPNNYWYVTG